MTGYAGTVHHISCRNCISRHFVRVPFTRANKTVHAGTQLRTYISDSTIYSAVYVGMVVVVCIP